MKLICLLLDFVIPLLYTRPICCVLYTLIRMLLMVKMFLLSPTFPHVHVRAPYTMFKLKFDVSRIRSGKLLISLIRGHLCGRVRRRRFLYSYSSIKGNAKLDLVIAHIILNRSTNNRYHSLMLYLQIIIRSVLMIATNQYRYQSDK